MSRYMLERGACFVYSEAGVVIRGCCGTLLTQLVLLRLAIRTTACDAQTVYARIASLRTPRQLDVAGARCGNRYADVMGANR